MMTPSFLNPSSPPILETGHGEPEDDDDPVPFPDAGMEEGESPSSLSI
jgi:hypothetical protein